MSSPSGGGTPGGRSPFGLDGPQPLVQLDRRLGVGAPLHVDPQVRAGGRRVLREPDEVREADIGVLVEPELGRLDRDLAVDPGGRDALEQGSM